MTPPLLAGLREATAENHRRLESRITIARVDVTPAEYTATLRAYLGFYTPLEARLQHVVGSVEALQWNMRRKTHLLERDLKRLGMNSTELTRLPRCAAVPSIGSVPEAIGLMYVMEGATLGGRYLLKSVPRLQDLDATAFLQGYGAATACMWKQFIGFLWQVDSPAAQGQSIATAVASFARFETWLDESGVLK